MRRSPTLLVMVHIASRVGDNINTFSHCRHSGGSPLELLLFVSPSFRILSVSFSGLFHSFPRYSLGIVRFSHSRPKRACSSVYYLAVITTNNTDYWCSVDVYLSYEAASMRHLARKETISVLQHKADTGKETL